MSNWRINGDLRYSVLNALEYSILDGELDRSDLANKFVEIAIELIENCPKFAEEVQSIPELNEFFKEYL